MSDSSGRRGAGPASDSDAGGPPDAETDEEGESEWRFGLDEVGADAEGRDGSQEDARPGARPKEPMEPGSVSLENAVFVLAGALGTLLLFWLLATP
jgi:hypothetical protein